MKWSHYAWPKFGIWFSSNILHGARKHEEKTGMGYRTGFVNDVEVTQEYGD